LTRIAPTSEILIMRETVKNDSVKNKVFSLD
jgi:hypothetical protein